MKAKRLLSLLQMVLCLGIAATAFFFIQDWWKWVWIVGSILFGLFFFVLACKREVRSKGTKQEASFGKRSRITELILLSEDHTGLARWNLYGKTGIVIGRDVGENHVNVNLDQAAYAGMIETEHAVLNYSADQWYIEDLSSKNGVSVQKVDGRKYRIAPGKPCKLEKGDIIFIALTRLLIC